MSNSSGRCSVPTQAKINRRSIELSRIRNKGFINRVKNRIKRFRKKFKR